MPSWPISSKTNIAVSWSIASLIVATTPKLIRSLTTKPPFTAISFANSPTCIVSGTSTFFDFTLVGASNWCSASASGITLDSFLLYSFAARDNWSLTFTFGWAGTSFLATICFSLSSFFNLAASLIWSSRFFCCSFNCSEAAALFASILSE